MSSCACRALNDEKCYSPLCDRDGHTEHRRRASGRWLLLDPVGMSVVGCARRGQQTSASRACWKDFISSRRRHHTCGCVSWTLPYLFDSEGNIEIPYYRRHELHLRQLIELSCEYFLAQHHQASTSRLASAYALTYFALRDEGSASKYCIMAFTSICPSREAAGIPAEKHVRQPAPIACRLSENIPCFCTSAQFAAHGAINVIYHNHQNIARTISIFD